MTTLLYKIYKTRLIDFITDGQRVYRQEYISLSQIKMNLLLINRRLIPLNKTPYNAQVKAY